MLMVGVLAAPSLAGEDVQSIRSREVELHYKLGDGDATSIVTLWYTRDRGATWQKFGIDEDRRSPIVFTAPAEGLYGLLLSVGGPEGAKPPAAFATPQRWVFVDNTAPLLQIDSIEPGDDFAARRLLQIRWTSHDDHFGLRPISLAWQNDGEKNWRVLFEEMPNLGRFDWKVPPEAKASVLIRIAAKDQAGNIMERVSKPLPMSRLIGAVMASPSPTTRPVAEPASRPSITAADLDRRRKAEESYQQGSWHLVRGQYAVAAERFRESLDLDRTLQGAANDLAGIYYMQKDYTKALELYQGVLAKDKNHVDALRGLALTYVARKEYSQSRDALKRLLDANNKDAEAWLDLGDVLFMMGNQTEARGYWNKAAGIDPLAQQVIAKARRRLELYGTDSTSSGSGSN